MTSATLSRSETDNRQRRSCLQGRRRRRGPAFHCLLLVQILAGCGSGTSGAPSSGTPPPSTSPPPPTIANSGHGHFRGTATVGSELHHAEAILTIDGEYRIYIGSSVTAGDGPLTGAGLSGDLLNPEESTQVFGHLEMNGNQGVGGGLAVGQTCALPDPGRFCDERPEVEVSITDATAAGLAGEIRIPTSTGEETWLLEMAAWSAYYESGANVASLAGTYREELAPFTQGGNVIISIDGAARLFFQDAISGCTGNGVLGQHLDGAFDVFDVALTIENCSADFDFLNSSNFQNSDGYSGLAIETQNGYWDYDNWLLIIVASPGWELPAAVTMYARRL